MDQNREAALAAPLTTGRLHNSVEALAHLNGKLSETLEALTNYRVRMVGMQEPVATFDYPEAAGTVGAVEYQIALAHYNAERLVELTKEIDNL